MCPTVLDGLPTAAYSRARTHHYMTRGLLSAAFLPWTGASLLRQPGHLALRQGTHIDAMLGADA